MEPKRRLAVSVPAVVSAPPSVSVAEHSHFLISSCELKHPRYDECKNDWASESHNGEVVLNFCFLLITSEQDHFSKRRTGTTEHRDLVQHVRVMKLELLLTCHERCIIAIHHSQRAFFQCKIVVINLLFVKIRLSELSSVSFVHRHLEDGYEKIEGCITFSLPAVCQSSGSRTL